MHSPQHAERLIIVSDNTKVAVEVCGSACLDDGADEVRDLSLGSSGSWRLFFTDVFKAEHGGHSLCLRTSNYLPHTQ